MIYAKEKGFESAKYNFVCFVDDDNWLCENYVNTAFEIMNSDVNIAVLGGQGEAVCEIEKPKWLETYSHAFAVSKQADASGEITNEKNFVYGASCVIRKNYWEKIKSAGFESLTTGRKEKNITSGEDVEICLTMKMAGFKIWYDERLKFMHYIPKERLSLDYIKKYYKGNGKTYFYLNAYKYFIKNDTLPQSYLKYSFWFDQFIFNLKHLPKHLYFLILSSKQKTKYFDASCLCP